MAKTPLEKQIEKAQKEVKLQAQKQLKESQKQAREERRMANREATRQRAATIVGGQPTVWGIRIMDSTAEETLKCLLEKCSNLETGYVNYDYENFPEYVTHDLSLELEKLVQYGMVTGVNAWMSGGMLNLLPPAFTYFSDKEAAQAKQEEQRMGISIGSIVNSGNLVLGDAVNSSFSIDNSIDRIEKEIEERGGADKEELKELLAEVKELTENMETTRSIPKQKGLFKRLSDHMATHGWFYAEVVALLGQQALSLLGT